MKVHLKYMVSAAVVAVIVMSIPLNAAGVRRSTADYTVPKVTLVRADGKSVSLPEELNDGRPVVMSFIFTTCTSICPVLTQTLANLQTALGANRDKVHMVSISIDPEQDTPERLTAYAQKYHAGPEWQLYTGSVDAIIATAKAFNVFSGDKMGHRPVILLRKAPGEPWIRLDGFASAEQLLQEIRSEEAASNK